MADEDQPTAVNQGATGQRPYQEGSHAPRARRTGETPLSAGTDDDPFAERPEAFVGAAFAGGLALALILRRLTR